jgi:hypothetical protein
MSEERYFRERARIEQGHVKYRDKLKDEGKLFVRDRLKLLLDPGSPFQEDFLFARSQEADTPADGVELKDELGLDHFEGRGWRGFHHHASLCIAAYAFLAAERLAHFPPQPLAFLRPARLPKRFTPRGAPRAS